MRKTGAKFFKQREPELKKGNSKKRRFISARQAAYLASLMGAIGISRMPLPEAKTQKTPAEYRAGAIASLKRDLLTARGANRIAKLQDRLARWEVQA